MGKYSIWNIYHPLFTAATALAAAIVIVIQNELQDPTIAAYIVVIGLIMVIIILWYCSKILSETI